MPKVRLIDVSKCIACRACQIACKQWNSLEAIPTQQEGTYENPPELSSNTWIKIEFKERPHEWLFRAHTCMHCTDAGCEQVCPTGAISHHGEIVYIDQNWCIGCGYCTQACPFQIPHKDEISGTVRKCTFCIDRITIGQQPACAKTCPTGAIQFGERDNLLAVGEQRVQILVTKYGYRRACVYGEKELGGLHTLYVLTDEPSVFGLPDNPRLATSAVGNQWLSGVLTAGVIAILPLWLLFRRKNQNNHNEDKSKAIGDKR